jgi:hypothetical protein
MWIAFLIIMVHNEGKCIVLGGSKKGSYGGVVKTFLVRSMKVPYGGNIYKIPMTKGVPYSRKPQGSFIWRLCIQGFLDNLIWFHMKSLYLTSMRI